MSFGGYESEPIDFARLAGPCLRTKETSEPVALPVSLARFSRQGERYANSTAQSTGHGTWLRLPINAPDCCRELEPRWVDIAAI